MLKFLSQSVVSDDVTDMAPAPKPIKRSKIRAGSIKKRVGLIDVAREAGVSPATVSRVLHNKPLVSETVRERVKKTAIRLNYRPHYSARRLAQGRTGYVAIATPRGSHQLFSSPYVTRVLDGIGQVLDETSMRLLLSTTPSQFEDLTNSHVVDGIFLLEVTLNDPYLDELEKSDTPVVMIGDYKKKTRFTVYTPDYESAIRMGVEHLVELGHREIGFICGPPNRYKWKPNVKTFQSLIKKHNLREVGSVVSPNYEEETGYRIFSEMIEKGKETPTGYVSTSDFLASGFMRAALDHGWSVPGDLSMVGYGDIPIAALSRPPLTTVGGSLIGVGAQAARNLIDLIEGIADSPVRYTIPLKLIVRESAGRPLARVQ